MNSFDLPDLTTFLKDLSKIQNSNGSILDVEYVVKLLDCSQEAGRRAIDAQTKGDYFEAERYFQDATALRRDAYKELNAIEISACAKKYLVDRINTGEDISFGGNASMTRCERACAEKADGIKNTRILNHW